MNEVLKRLQRKAIIAHRGFSAKYVENTIPAFLAAANAGADIVELDVHSTKDNEIIVFHDDNLKRLTGVDVKIKDVDYKELLKYEIKGNKIPRLIEVIDILVNQHNTPILVEIKDPTDTKLVIDECKNYSNWISIISFHENVLDMAKEWFITGIVYYTPPGKIIQAKEKKYEIVLPRYTLATEKAINLAHKLGLKVIAWTVNDEEWMKELWFRGIDGIATDSVELGKKIKEEYIKHNY